MGYLFMLVDNGDAVLHPHCFKVVPELKNLSDEDIMFLILYCDYYSPYSQLPEKDRLQRSMVRAYGDKEVDPLNSEMIKKGIEAYMSLQYDPRRVQIEAYRKKIEMVNESLMMSESPSEIKGLLSTNAELERSIKALEAEINESTLKTASLLGDKKNSLLEVLMKNRKEWEKRKKKVSLEYTASTYSKDQEFK